MGSSFGRSRAGYLLSPIHLNIANRQLEKSHARKETRQNTESVFDKTFEFEKILNQFLIKLSSLKI